MAGFVPSLAAHDHADLRAQVQRAVGGGAPRDQLEYLMGDVAAEILLLEVDLRRVERALLASLGPRVQPRDVQAQVELRDGLELALTGLRELAGEIRARLQSGA